MSQHEKRDGLRLTDDHFDPDGEELLKLGTRPNQDRRRFLGGAASLAFGASAFASTGGFKSSEAAENNQSKWIASPPAGFVPFSAPGRVVKVTKPGSLQENKLYPKPDAAKDMLEKALIELTGKADMRAAVSQFVHPADVVLVKVNGIAKSTGEMGTNKELVLPLLEAMIQVGVKPEKITVLEQYNGFMAGTRIRQDNVPKGVQVISHGNAGVHRPGDKANDAMAPMRDQLVPTTGVRTRFVKPVLDSTAIINFSLIKDHSICGYTGCLKNLTHGCIVNPHDFHVHHANPQIAAIYGMDILRSRVRLHITDGYKIMAQGGPLWKYPQYVLPHEAVYAATDPVAMDTIGWEEVEKARKNFKLKSLAEENREPGYIKVAADLGLGVFARGRIQVNEFAI